MPTMAQTTFLFKYTGLCASVKLPTAGLNVPLHKFVLHKIRGLSNCCRIIVLQVHIFIFLREFITFNSHVTHLEMHGSH